MPETIIAREEIAARVSPIVEHFIQNDPLFKELDRNKIIGIVLNLIERKLSLKEFRELTDEILSRKIRRVLGVEALAGLLSDFTPEEMAKFDAAVLRN